jgi:hypothetical protein
VHRADTVTVATFVIHGFDTFIRVQAQSVMSAKDRYLQRKAGASTAAAPAVKKEQNATEPIAALPEAAAASSIRVKKEAEAGDGVRMKRE